MQLAELQKLIEDASASADIKIVSDENSYLDYSIKNIKYDKDSKKVTISIKPAYSNMRDSDRGIEL